MRYYLMLILVFLGFFAACRGEDFHGVWSHDLHQLLAIKGKHLKVGLISAKPYEQGNLMAMMENVQEEQHGKRTFYKGKLFDIDTVLTISRVGKVASAITTTELIAKYDVDLIIFFGTAGAIDDHVKRGDLIIGKMLVQHDMDASPFVPPFTVPMIKVREFFLDPHLIELARAASQKFISTQLNQALPISVMEEFMLMDPTIHEGLIASGDLFVSNQKLKQDLKCKFTDLLCVEMEGAAVAQVAYEYDIPCLVIRVASDTANAEAYENFMAFLENIAPVYAHNILKNLFECFLIEAETTGN